MFDDVYLVDDHLALVDAAAIDQLEARLEIPLPDGYREFLTVLGVGTYCDLVTVIEPDQIIEQTESAQKEWDEYFFWEQGDHVLTKEQILTSIILANTLDGDEIILCPESLDNLYVLPRHDGTVYHLDSSFSDPLDWRSENGRVVTPPPFRYFEPWGDRAYIELFTASTNHNVEDILQMSSRLLADDGETKHISGSNHLLFVKAVGERLQFTTGGDPRICIRIDYHQQYVPVVDHYVRELESLDFYVTGRSSTG